MLEIADVTKGHCKQCLQCVNENIKTLIFHGRPVAYLGYGRHGTCHGGHFDGGAKIAWKN